MKNACLVATIALLSGCSLINSLDSVKPATDENDGGGDGARGGKGGKSGTGGASGKGGTGGASGASGGVSGKGGAAGSAMGGDTGAAGMDAGAGGGMPDSSAGGSGGGEEAGAGGNDGGPVFMPGGPNGAIVAFDPGPTTQQGKIWVLDPTDAHAVSSVASPVVAAIANDPATDYWYVFIQVMKPTDPHELHVRQLNTTTGAWHELGAPVMVPAPAGANIGVLNQRLAYISTDPLNPTAGAFTVLDTSNAPTVTVAANGRNRALPAGGKVALTAHASPTAVGGTVTIALQAQQGACDQTMQACAVGLLGEIINATTIKEDSAPTLIGSVYSTGGSMGFAGTDNAGTPDVALIPPASPLAMPPMTCTANSGGMGSAVMLDTSHKPSGTAVPFDMGTVRVNGATFDPCHDIVFATSLLNDTATWAIPMGGGTPQKLCNASGGGALLFEPYTHGILRATPDNSRFELYSIDETDLMAPKLVARTLKLPPLLSKAPVIAIRRPKQVCK